MTGPLHGTHLAETDCTRCGRYVLAVPERADDAMCAECRREVTGATGDVVPQPAHWSGGNRSSAPVRTIVMTAPPVAEMAWKVRCPRCLWRGRVATAEDIPLVLRVHEKLRHQRDGWASGVPGGLTGRERRR